jgi:hypothetical protein
MHKPKKGLAKKINEYQKARSRWKEKMPRKG